MKIFGTLTGNTKCQFVIEVNATVSVDPYFGVPSVDWKVTLLSPWNSKIAIIVIFSLVSKNLKIIRKK